MLRLAAGRWRSGLHQVVDPGLANDVALVIYARAADETWPELAWLAEMEPAQREAFSEQYRGKLRTIAQRQAALTQLATTPSERPLPPDPVSRPDRVEEFRDDDDGYLAWIAEHPDGYVINILRGLNPSTARLHHAGCRTVTGTPPRGGPWTGPYIKVCAEQLDELDQWAVQHAGRGITRCGVCRPPGPRRDG